MKNKRCYALFEIEILSNGRKKYHLIHPDAYYKDAAVRIFQSALLAKFFGTADRERCLRPVRTSRPVECGFTLEKPFMKES